MSIPLTEAQAERIGKAIVKELQVLGSGGRYFLTSGTKTHVGVAHTVNRILNNIEEWEAACTGT